MERQLQMRVDENPENYLGIPSFWEKSKCAAMGFIKERIEQKLQGWKSYLLSQRGREVLIKTVASAILIYTMQCSKIPKKIYEEINAKMAKFWWGQKHEESKIHWISWMGLTSNKERVEWDLRT